MKLVPENFKLIPTTYNGNDFMKIQYEDKDLVMKLKGEFHIIDVKNYGLRLIFTPDDYSIIDKIHEMAGYKNKSELNSISLSMNKTTPFFNHKNILMDQNKCRSKHNALKKSRCVDASPSVFHHFQLFTTDSTHMQNRSKSMNSSKKKKLNLCLIMKTKFYLIFQIKLFPSSKSSFPSS